MWLVGIGIMVAGVLMLASLAIVVHLVVAGLNSRRSAYSVPTPANVIDEILQALKMPEGGVIMEPGCGDGRVLAAILAADPTVRAMGVDNDPVMVGAAWFRTRGRARLSVGNLWNMRFSEADRVFAYLRPELMKALEPRFEQELQAGARLVSLQFALPQRRPDRVIELERGRPHAQTVYVYDY